MAVRIGIELSPATCRIIELEHAPAARGEGPRTASVVLWTPHSSCQVSVQEASPVLSAPPRSGQGSPVAASVSADSTPALPPIPFGASLGTILYGPERKLAIVDGRIVQSGDDVKGAVVADITPTSVYLRDAQGRLRRLTAGGTGR